MTLTTGQLAQKSGVGVETIRFYERKGLLREPPRRESGYRIYTEDAVARVRFIRRAKELGFTLTEIMELLALQAENDATCADVRKRAEANVSKIDRQITALKSIRKDLVRLTQQCVEDHPRSQCPILQSLNEETDAR
jgi:MerR family copper efflux transcriptional regulator